MQNGAPDGGWRPNRMSELELQGHEMKKTMEGGTHRETGLPGISSISAKLAAMIFTIEIGLMWFVHRMGIPGYLELWVDATLLTGLCLLGIYRFVVRPHRDYQQRLRNNERRLKSQALEQKALLAASRSIQSILLPSDLEGVIQGLYGQMRNAGLDFEVLAIHRLLEEETQTFESYEVQASKAPKRLVGELPNVHRMWQRGKTTYRPDVKVDMGGLDAERLQTLNQHYGIDIRCILDVPHPRGTMALLSDRPDAFSGDQKRFVQQVADVLSIGLTRVEDLERVRESEEMFRAITASAQDAIIIMDNEGKIAYWNDAAATIFDYPVGEVLGQNLHALLTPDRFREAQDRAFPGFRETGEGAAIGQTLELVGIKRGGREFPIELSLAAVQLKEKWHAVGIIRDISQRKAMEASLRNAERNRVLMETAGAAAHEINQPLAVISGLAQLMLKTTQNGDTQRGDLEAICEGCDRIKEILGRMEETRQYATTHYVGDVEIVEFGAAAGEDNRAS